MKLGNEKSVGILGVGMSVPEKVLTNSDLEKMVDTTDEWITKRTGISERRILGKDTPSNDMAFEAAQRAIEDAKISAEDIDLIIVATITPDYATPSMSCIIQSRLNAHKAAAFDLNAACTGFVYGLTVAEQFIKTGYYKKVLIIGCDGLSKITDWEDRNTCVLFGDGAGAVIVGEVENGYGIIGTKIGAEGNIGHVLTVPCNYLSKKDSNDRLHDNKRVLWMDGSEVFKFAIRVMEKATTDVLKSANMSIEDIDLVVPHQANIRIVNSAIKKLKISKEKVISNLDKYGNTSAASIPLALCEAYNNKMIKKGSNIVLVGFGGGLTWAATLIKWAKE